MPKFSASQTQSNIEPQIEVTYYTDPLCCWSWAFEPQWQQFLMEFGQHLHYRYVMGGLLPNWSSYTDPMNSVSKPLQMGPVWLEAQQVSGQPIKSRIWFDDPPASSFPACMAVKCAGLQSEQAEELMLQKLREAIMLQGQNIARKEVIMDVAREIASQYSGVFNLEQFGEKLDSEEVRNAFRNDLQKAKLHSIGRFPTLTFAAPGGKGVMVTGYRPYQALVQALRQVAPQLTGNPSLIL